MIDKLYKLLSPYVPVGFAMKGISQLDPKYKKFLTGAIAGGYTADQAIGFLRDKFTSGNPNAKFDKFEKQGNLSSEEGASQAFRGNQKRFEGALESGAKGAAALVGGGVASGILGGAEAMQGGAAYPSAIDQMPQRPEQIEGRSPKQIGYDEFNPQPKEGESVTPPIQPNQQQQAARITALKKARELQQQKSMLEQEVQRFQQGYQQRVADLRQQEEAIQQEMQQGQQQAPEQGNMSKEEMIRIAFEKIMGL